MSFREQKIGSPARRRANEKAGSRNDSRGPAG